MELPLIPHAQCVAIKNSTRESQICAGNQRDARLVPGTATLFIVPGDGSVPLQGDSGGPLFIGAVERAELGVVSFGVLCGVPNNPGRCSSTECVEWMQ